MNVTVCHQKSHKKSAGIVKTTTKLEKLETHQKAFDEDNLCFRCKTEHKNEIDRMVLMNKIMTMAKSDLSFEEK